VICPELSHGHVALDIGGQGGLAVGHDGLDQRLDVSIKTMLDHLPDDTCGQDHYFWQKNGRFSCTAMLRLFFSI
jgi:hypothetical protein